MKKSASQNAFTLIELLVVISIIALLVAILMPALSKAKEQAKMALCSNNLHQLAIGVQTYNADNDDRYPPHATRAARPNLLARNKNAGDDYQYRYLGKYLPEVDVFNCPMSNFDPDAIWDVGGSQYTYQELYENKGNWFASTNFDLSCSYVLLWNFDKYTKRVENSDSVANNRIPSRPFNGPGKKSKNKLLACDSFYFSNNLAPTNRWTSNHKFKNSSKHQSIDKPYFIANSVGSETDLDTNPDLQNIQLNAAMTDGSVHQYQSGASVRQQAVPGWAATFLPPISMWK